MTKHLIVTLLAALAAATALPSASAAPEPLVENVCTDDVPTSYCYWRVGPVECTYRRWMKPQYECGIDQDAHAADASIDSVVCTRDVPPSWCRADAGVVACEFGWRTPLRCA